MADREDMEKAGGKPAATPNGAPDANSSETPAAATNDLPVVEAPPLSPAGAPEPVAEPRLDTAIPFGPDSPIAPAPTARSAFAFSARGKRNALLAASVAIAAALGAVVGALASGGFAKTVISQHDVAAVQERQAMQQSIAQLSKDIATLKAGVEAANKSSHTQIAKISERLARERADITGSISAPRTAAPSAQAPAALPPSRPFAVIDRPPGIRLPVVPDWSLRTAHDGYALVEGRGAVYEVMPGDPVPGLGRIEQIRREGGRWVVVTQRGIVVSMRDRRYFEPF